MLVGCLTPVPERLLDGSKQLVGTQLIIPIVLFLCALSARAQQGSLAAAGQRAERRRRQYSVAPYLAVAAIDALLVWLLAAPGDDGELLIGCAAALVTGLVVVRQITAFQDNQRLLARLDHSATHDTLTHLPNRRLFNQRLHEALNLSGSHSVSIALIDLDDFKTVNDTLGHDVGDALLVEVAQRLLGCVRPGDTVARLGGDEFVLILDGVAPTDTNACAERIIGALTAAVRVNGHDLLVRASIGIADGRTGDDPGELLREADIAMYAAKTMGGSGYRRYEPEMAITVTGSADATSALRQAIADEQLFLLYQPIVSLETGEMVGVEALVRWAHPVRGIVSPDEFIPVAERTGLIVDLGRWVLRRACAQLASWTDAVGAAAPALNVNVSARELREPSFADEVTAVIASAGVAPHQLTLEITETAVLELGFSLANVRALQQLGVRIALDDFGTGHSTLTVLQNCPVDQLKLDRSFTQGERPIVAAGVLHLSRGLGLHVVVEGVENAEQADRMRLLGFEHAQGFHFAAPLPPSHIDRLLAAPRALSPAPR
jgi:diguanylate cyclase (GGDEF)-like protein